MAEFLVAFCMAFIFLLLAIAILSIPVLIANARGITGGERTAIIVLSVFGIFFSITWFVALILSLALRGDCCVAGDELDRLEKLAKLYKDKVITKDEYERMKSKLIRE